MHSKQSVVSNKLAKPKMKNKTTLSTEDKAKRKLVKEMVMEERCSEMVLPLIEKEPAYRERIMEHFFTQGCKYLKPLKKLEAPRSNYLTDLHIQDYRKYECTLEGLHKAFYETLSMIKLFTNADEAYLYLTEDNNKIYRYFDSECRSYATRWPIAPGTIIAAFVAYSQECLMVTKSSLVNEKYPLGLGRRGVLPNSVISVPAITPDRKVLAVFEFVKRNSGCFFNKDELNYAIATGAWMAAALTRKQAKQQLLQIKAYNWRLLKYFKSFLNGKLEVDNFVSMSMMSMKDCVKAEEVIYYSRIADRKLEIEVFEEVVKASQHLERVIRKISWALSDEVFKQVITNHEVINISGNQIQQYYNQEGSEQIRSVLCVPVGTHKRTLGIVKVVNKIGLPNFNQDDEMLATSAAVYCASALLYAAIAGQLHNMQEVVQRQKRVLIYHLRPCSHEIEAFKSKVLVKPPANYVSFAWYPALNELDNLADFSYWMFQDLFEGDPMMDNFHYFILMCKKGYRDMPYHNFEHAFHATHCMFCIIRSAAQKFTYLEQLALMIAMICHDVDHPGFTNNYMRQISHDLSILYRDSFLENHHSNITKILISECNLFGHLSQNEFKNICDEIHSLIMATDLKLYFRKKMAIMDLLKQGIFNESLADHKTLMKKLMMTSCDLSGQCKPFKVTQRLTFNLYKELYKEGDKLRAIGIEPLAVMDRNNYLDIPSDQVHFLSEVVLPCTLVLSEIIPETKDLHTLSSAVCETWRVEKNRRMAQAAAMAAHAQTAAERQAASFLRLKKNL